MTWSRVYEWREVMLVSNVCVWVYIYIYIVSGVKCELVWSEEEKWVERVSECNNNKIKRVSCTCECLEVGCEYKWSIRVWVLYKYFCTTFSLIKIKSFISSLVLQFSTSDIRARWPRARTEQAVKDRVFSALRASDQGSCYVEVSLVRSTRLWSLLVWD